MSRRQPPGPPPFPGARWVTENDPEYPIERWRKDGTIELTLEILHDHPDTETLTEEAWVLVAGFLRSKGCEVGGGSSFYRARGLWLREDELRRVEGIPGSDQALNPS